MAEGVGVVAAVAEAPPILECRTGSNLCLETKRSVLLVVVESFNEDSILFKGRDLFCCCCCGLWGYSSRLPLCLAVMNLGVGITPAVGEKREKESKNGSNMIDLPHKHIWVHCLWLTWVFPPEFVIDLQQLHNQMEFKAVQVNAFNAAAPTDGAAIVTRTLSEPGPQEVQVKLLLAGVNPSDVFSLMGVYPGFTTKLPGVPGFDGELWKQ